MTTMISGLTTNLPYDDIRQELLNNLIGTSDSASLEVEATPKIFKGKKDIIAINPIEANALSITFGIDFWTDLDSSLCTIKEMEKMQSDFKSNNRNIIT